MKFFTNFMKVMKIWNLFISSCIPTSLLFVAMLSWRVQSAAKLAVTLDDDDDDDTAGNCTKIDSVAVAFWSRCLLTSLQTLLNSYISSQTLHSSENSSLTAPRTCRTDDIQGRPSPPPTAMTQAFLFPSSLLSFPFLPFNGVTARKIWGIKDVRRWVLEHYVCKNQHLY